jgi:hypothetical protein
MFRSLLMAALLAQGAPLLARTGPEIAYSTSSSVYLVNPNGSGKVQLYRGKGNSFISSVSLKPGGGEIAIVDNWVLKFVDYDSSGRQVGTTRSIASTCFRLADVHYRPDGSSVLYQELCGNDRYVKQVAVPTVANPSPAPSTLLTSPYLTDVTWDADGQGFVYALTTDTQWELRRHHLAGGDDLIAARAQPQFRFPDVANSGATLVISDSPLGTASGFTSEIDAQNGTSIRSNFVAGQMARYSPDDTRVLFIAKQGSGSYLRIKEPTNLQTQIGGRDSYSSVDWGN